MKTILKAVHAGAIMLGLVIGSSLSAQPVSEPDNGPQASYDSTTGAWTVSWWGRAGRTYFLQHSLDLKTWTNLDVMEPGQDQTMSYGMTSTAPNNFWRMGWADTVVADPDSADFDGDGLSNRTELDLGTYPLTADTDGDGMSDGYEVTHGLDPMNPNDASTDLDGDGLTNFQEYQMGTNPNSVDSDGDGLADSQENTLGTNPLNPDSDSDGMPDGWEIAHGLNPLSASDASADLDGDGLTNLQEYQAGSDPRDFYNGAAPLFSAVTNTSSVSVSLNGYSGALAGATPVNPVDAGNPGLISVTLTKPDGTPLANAPVTFVFQGTGGISSTPSGTASNQLTVLTDSNGVARVSVGGSTSGALSVTPQGSDATGAPDQNHATIDLGSNLVPLGVATDGTITLRGFNPDGTAKILRWRNGVMTQLQVPQSIYTYSQSQYDPLANFYPELNSFGQGFQPFSLTPSGMLCSYASDRSPAGGSGESFAVVWPINSLTPLVLKGPVFLGPPYPEGGPNIETSWLTINRVGNNDEIWVGSPDGIDGARSNLGQLSITYDSNLLSSAGIQIENGPFGFSDVNSNHQPIGWQDQQGSTIRFVGSTAQQVDFMPLAINDAGVVLGDDLSPDGSYSGGGAVLRNIEAYSANIIQTAIGAMTTKPFVYANSQKIYLRGVSANTIVRVVGLDSAGNVYGSFNPVYENGLASPGQNVIWVAQPTQWGLPASTPAYTPVSWALPTLGGSWQPTGATSSPTGVSPLGSGIQLGLAFKTDDAAGNSSLHAFAQLPMQLLTDVNDDGVIDATDAMLISAAQATNANADTIEKGTEYMFVDNQESNGAWDIDDASKPAGMTADDDAQELKVILNPNFGAAWFDHPAINNLAFYATKACAPGDKINFPWNLSSNNALPTSIYVRAEGTFAGQVEGNLTLIFGSLDKSQTYAESKVRLVVVKGLGDSKFYNACRDYILENNSKFYTMEKTYGLETMRTVIMLQERTTIKALDGAYPTATANTIDQAVATNPSQAVIINGMFEDNGPFPYTSPPKVAGPLISGGVLDTAISLNNATDPMDYYVAQAANGTFTFGKGAVPANTYQEVMGGFYRNIGVAEGSASTMVGQVVLGTKKLIFCTVTKMDTVHVLGFGTGNGVTGFASDALKAGASSITFFDGSSSCALAYSDPAGILQVEFSGAKHWETPPKYHIHTFLMFSCTKPRN